MCCSGCYSCSVWSILLFCFARVALVSDRHYLCNKYILFVTFVYLRTLYVRVCGINSWTHIRWVLSFACKIKYDRGFAGDRTDTSSLSGCSYAHNCLSYKGSRIITSGALAAFAAFRHEQSTQPTWVFTDLFPRALEHRSRMKARASQHCWQRRGQDRVPEATPRTLWRQRHRMERRDEDIMTVMTSWCCTERAAWAVRGCLDYVNQPPNYIREESHIMRNTNRFWLISLLVGVTGIKNSATPKSHPSRGEFRAYLAFGLDTPVVAGIGINSCCYSSVIATAFASV
jgi:hypothetical protein